MKKLPCILSTLAHVRRGSPPYGVNPDGSWNSAELRAIRAILSLHDRGESIDRTILLLNAARHPPRGRRWHPQTIQRIRARYRFAARCLGV